MQETIDNPWVNWNGEPKSYFDIGGLIKPFGRDEHFDILESYLQSDLSKDAFCDHYHIGSRKGFKEMLDIFSRESEELAKRISAKHSSNKFDERDVALVGMVGLGKLPVEVLINKSNNISFEEAINLADEKWGKKGKDILVYRVVDYYFKRVNSYKWGDSSVENIDKLLTCDEIRFIAGTSVYEKFQFGAGKLAYDDNSIKKRGSIIAGAFLRNTSYLNGENNELYAKRINYGDEKRQRSSTIDVYGALLEIRKPFLKELYLQDKTFLDTPKNGMVEISPEIIDQAYNYVLEKNIFPSDNAVKLAIRAVANGDIRYSEITDERRRIIERSIKKVESSKLSDVMDNIDNYTM